MEKRLPDAGSLRVRSHCIHIDNRSMMSITGVKDVSSFNESEVLLLTDCGDLCIEGNDLHITRLDLEDGQVIVEGELVAFEYEDVPDGKSKLFGKIFK
ncbi:MAG: sporulation protein YabP [Clostridia bacterium]